jgi:hypothetical protein
MNLLRNGMVIGTDFAGKSEQEHNIPCLQDKVCRKPFKSSQRTRAKEKLELLHSDLCWAMPVSSLNGANYTFTLVDDCTRKFFYFLKIKDQVKATFEDFKVMAENETGLKIRKIHTMTLIM